MLAEAFWVASAGTVNFRCSGQSFLQTDDSCDLGKGSPGTGPATIALYSKLRGKQARIIPAASLRLIPRVYGPRLTPDGTKVGATEAGPPSVSCTDITSSSFLPRC